MRLIKWTKNGIDIGEEIYTKELIFESNTIDSLKLKALEEARKLGFEALIWHSRYPVMDSDSIDNVSEFVADLNESISFEICS